MNLKDKVASVAGLKDIVEHSPNGLFYDKNEILYGLYEALAEIHKHKFVYITEGYKDVLAMHAAGFRNTVALCGMALTEQQAEVLGYYTHYAIVILNGDKAGQANGIKSAWLLASKGFSVARILLKPEHDPDSLLCEMGVQAFIGYVKAETRFARLEVYETDLQRKIEQSLSELHLALTFTERTDLFTYMLLLHKRLAKVTRLLTHSPVMKADWLLNF